MSQRVTQRRRLFKVSIGDLRERITLEDKSLNVDGVYPEIEKSVLEVWAKVSTELGIAEFMGSNIDSSAYAKSFEVQFTIRYRDDLDTNYGVNYKGDNYKIIKIEDPDKRHMYLSLSCSLEGKDKQENNA